MTQTILYSLIAAIILFVGGGIIGYVIHKPPAPPPPIIAHIDSVGLKEMWVKPLVDSTHKLQDLIAEMRALKPTVGESIQRFPAVLPIFGREPLPNWSKADTSNPIVPIFIADSAHEVTVPAEYYDRQADTLIYRDSVTTIVRTHVEFAGSPLNMYRMIQTSFSPFSIPVYTHAIPVIQSRDEYPFLGVSTSLGMAGTHPSFGFGVMIKDFGGDLNWVASQGVWVRASKYWRVF